MAKTDVRISNNYGDLNFLQKLRSNPSCVGFVINELAKISVPNDEIEALPVPFEIEEKITYNDLVENKHLIEEYGYYQTSIEGVYATIEQYHPSARAKIMRRINSQYRRVRAQLIADKKEGQTVHDVIREHSDYLIDKVRDDLLGILNSSNNIESTINEEDILFCVDLVVGDAFVKCKVLENPNH